MPIIEARRLCGGSISSGPRCGRGTLQLDPVLIWIFRRFDPLLRRMARGVSGVAQNGICSHNGYYPQGCSNLGYLGADLMASHATNLN
ncbi:MAG: hypothetical protein ACI9OD_003767 [Limisphaerales bacterium]|jgi:hypothetical protein